MKRSEAYFILEDMWQDANEQQREAIGIAQNDIQLVDLMPADVAEVNLGRWIEQNISGEQAWCCSQCKTLGSPHWKRCPVCEAKMIGGKENG